MSLLVCIMELGHMRFLVVLHQPFHDFRFCVFARFLPTVLLDVVSAIAVNSGEEISQRLFEVNCHSQSPQLLVDVFVPVGMISGSSYGSTICEHSSSAFAASSRR